MHGASEFDALLRQRIIERRRSDSDRLKRGAADLRAPARATALQRAFLYGRKTSRGDIIIGRPALILKARSSSTHDTISHSYGLHDGETLPVAQRQTSISNSSFFAPASKALYRVLRESPWKYGVARFDGALDEPRTAPSLGSPGLSVRKLRIAVESRSRFVGVEARRHYKKPAKPGVMVISQGLPAGTAQPQQSSLLFIKAPC
jgi:hypothetical protein